MTNQILEQVGVDFIGRIYTEYKRLHLQYAQTRQFKFKAKPKIHNLLGYCYQLLPLAHQLAGYGTQPSHSISSKLKRRLWGVLQIYVRNIYPNRNEFVQKIIQYLIKQIKKEKERPKKIKQIKPKKQRKKLQYKPITLVGNQWISEVYDEVIGQLHFVGKDLKHAKILLRSMLRYGAPSRWPLQYVRDSVYSLLRKALLARFGTMPWRTMNSRVQMVSKLLWKF